MPPAQTAHDHVLGHQAHGRKGWRLYVATAFLFLSNPIGVSPFFSAALLALLGVVLHLSGRKLHAPHVNVFLICFLAWCLLSLAWSRYPDTTFEAWMIVASAVLIGMVSVANCSALDLRTGIWMGGMATVVLSLALAAFAPAVAIVGENYQAGALQGPYVHRNILAYTLIVALAAGYGIRSPKQSSAWHSCAMAVTVVTLAATRSSTATIALCAYLVLHWGLRYLRRLPPKERWLPGVVGATLTGAVLWMTTSNFSVATEVVGRDTTLTGRTDIWKVVWLFIEHRPLTGYGWGSVWAPGQEPGSTIRVAIGYFVNHAHSGYLDTWLQVGVVGLVLLLLAVLVPIYQGVRGYFRQERTEGLWAPLTLVMFLVYAMAETRLAQPLGLMIITLVAGAVRLTQRDPSVGT